MHHLEEKIIEYEGKKYGVGRLKATFWEPITWQENFSLIKKLKDRETLFKDNNDNLYIVYYNPNDSGKYLFYLKEVKNDKKM